MRHTRFRAGFLQAQTDFPVKSKIPPLVMPTEEHNRIGQKQLARWLASYRPDAILTDIAILRKILEAEGYRVPKDIGLAALSVLDGNATAGIFQNSEDVGKAAVQTLISLINFHQQGLSDTVRETLIHGKWVEGDTLPKIS
jgi:LacI family transcriptional regulator